MQKHPDAPGGRGGGERSRAPLQGAPGQCPEDALLGGWCEDQCAGFCVSCFPRRLNPAPSAKDVRLTMAVPTEKAAIRQAMPRGRRRRQWWWWWRRGGGCGRRGRGCRNEAALAPAPRRRSARVPTAPWPRPGSRLAGAEGAGRRQVRVLLFCSCCREPGGCLGLGAIC